MKIQQFMDFGFSRNIHNKIYLPFAPILKIAEFFSQKEKTAVP